MTSSPTLRELAEAVTDSLSRSGEFNNHSAPYSLKDIRAMAARALKRPDPVDALEAAEGALSRCCDKEPGNAGLAAVRDMVRKALR